MIDSYGVLCNYMEAFLRQRKMYSMNERMLQGRRENQSGKGVYD
jgi:hypothetical protein